MGLHRGASPVFVMAAFVRVVAVAAALAADAANDGWRPQWRVRRGGGHRQDPSHIQRQPRPHPAYIVAVPVPYIQRLVSGKLPSECELLLTAVRRSSQEHNTQVIYAKFGVWTRPYVLSEHAVNLKSNGANYIQPSRSWRTGSTAAGRACTESSDVEVTADQYPFTNLIFVYHIYIYYSW
ncbi:uncharacterized protein LOC120694634 isoform X2 [Panicum virgatum]|uniref:uncharacterized protein LOC120694634 isoform X2 n=1 Tax=Panicum virgatum TaxID=38727 RepID=UPI0019D5674F|nr:uncharacterized protein LOC120694634 isoform X2 [Panicum virgatum]